MNLRTTTTSRLATVGMALALSSAVLMTTGSGAAAQRIQPYVPNYPGYDGGGGPTVLRPLGPAGRFGPSLWPKVENYRTYKMNRTARFYRQHKVPTAKQVRRGAKKGFPVKRPVAR
jgi:hypothetical protein